MFAEDVEALAPAVAMSVARLVAVEAGLLEDEPGALAEILEPHRHDGLDAGPAVLVVPHVRHHEELVRHDLAINAAEPERGAVGRHHAAAPFAARTHVALALCNGIAARRGPFREVILLGPAAPHQINRRVEHALQNQRTGRGGNAISCGHGSSP
jgi:hypothetical protein